MHKSYISYAAINNATSYEHTYLCKYFMFQIIVSPTNHALTLPIYQQIIQKLPFLLSSFSFNSLLGNPPFGDPKQQQQDYLSSSFLFWRVRLQSIQITKDSDLPNDLTCKNNHFTTLHIVVSLLQGMSKKSGQVQPHLCWPEGQAGPWGTPLAPYRLLITALGPSCSAFKSHVSSHVSIVSWVRRCYTHLQMSPEKDISLLFVEEKKQARENACCQNLRIIQYRPEETQAIYSDKCFQVATWKMASGTQV